MLRKCPKSLRAGNVKPNQAKVKLIFLHKKIIEIKETIFNGPNKMSYIKIFDVINYLESLDGI